jgi:cytochrome P450
MKTSALSFDIDSPGFQRDPYPFYRRLREAEPLHFSDRGLWVATRHRDIKAILSNKRFAKNFLAGVGKQQGMGVLQEPAYKALGNMLLVQDPPSHTRIRKLVAKAFTNSSVSKMESQVREIVSELLDGIAPRGSMDFIAEFAHFVPVLVICRILGVPKEFWKVFSNPNSNSGRITEMRAMDPEELLRANRGTSQSSLFFRMLCERRRREPQDDLITHLVHAEEEGSHLTEEELTANISLLFAAGHETTKHTLGNSVLALHQNPDQLALLKAEPKWIPNAVNECLRYESAVQVTYREATEDLEVGGVALPKGSGIMAYLGAGNRDPEAHAEPDRLDVTRANPSPLSFGGGIHLCLGAFLAQMEAQICLETLLERFPDSRIPDMHQPKWGPNKPFRGLAELRMTW